MGERKGIYQGMLCKILLLSAAAAVLVGCGRQEEPEGTELTFIHGWGGTVKTHSTMQEIYRAFDEENPDIVLNYQPSSDSYIAVEQANNMLAIDKMPDIVSTNGQSYYVQNAVKRGMALDLLPYIEADEAFIRSIHPSVLETWTEENGGLYTVPDALEVMGYWYNAGYFREAGIVDEKGNARPPQTWEEFREAFAKLDAWGKDRVNEPGEGRVDTCALENVQVAENLFLAVLAGKGPEGLQMAGALPDTFDTPVFRDAVREFSWIFSHSVSAESLDDAREYFREGRTAVYFNGIWECEEFKGCAAEADIAYANYPTESGESLSYISPSSGYVLFDSYDEKKKEASIRFLKYMLSEEVQLKLALETGQAPSNPNVDLAVIREEYPLLGNALEQAHAADIQIKTITSVWNSGVMETIGADIRRACMEEEALDSLISALDKGL